MTIIPLYYTIKWPLYVIYFKFSIYIFVVNILSSRNSANWLQGVFINNGPTTTINIVPFRQS